MESRRSSEHGGHPDSGVALESLSRVPTLGIAEQTNNILGRQRFWVRICLAVPLAWIAVFLMAPAVMLLITSFWTFHNFTIKHDWTAANYHAVLTRSNFHIFVFTVETAFLVVVIGLFVSYATAVFLSQLGRAAYFWLFLLILPFLSGTVIQVFSWRSLLGRNGVVNDLLESMGLPRATWLLYNQMSAVVVILYGVLAFMVLPIFASLKRIDPNLYVAAENLGSSRLYAFRRITLPMTRQGALIAVLLGFITAASASIVTVMLGGPSSLTWAQLIEIKMYKQGNVAEASAFAICFSAVTIGLIIAGLKLVRLEDLLPNTSRGEFDE